MKVWIVTDAYSGRFEGVYLKEEDAKEDYPEYRVGYSHYFITKENVIEHTTSR